MKNSYDSQSMTMLKLSVLSLQSQFFLSLPQEVFFSLLGLTLNYSQKKTYITGSLLMINRDVFMKTSSAVIVKHGVLWYTIEVL